MVTTTFEPQDPNVVVVGETRADYTYGGWLTEESSAKEFDWQVSETGLFNVFTEVQGDPLQLRVGQELKSMRIDRVLSPTPKLRESGWTLGPFGVELKKSDVKIGPVIALAIDYRTCAWYMPHGYKVVLDFIAIWPINKQHGTTASFMAQQRIGAISHSRHSLLKITCGECVLLDVPVNKDHPLRLNCKDFGRRAGSR